MAVRVLVLSDLWVPFPGGAERLMFNLARYLDCQDGIEVVVLTGYEGAKEMGGPRVIAVPIGDGDGDPGWSPVQNTINHLVPDVILTHHHYARLFAAELEATQIPVVQVVLNGQRLPFAKHALYITDHVRSLDPSARDTDQMMWPPAMADVVATTHGDAIGFIKPIPHKGVDLVYRIARHMHDRRFLVLRGEWQTLETIPRQGIANVEFMDPVDDIREFWERCRLVLAPSRSEDAGTIAQEATLNGIPCISSDVDGLRETNGGGIRITSRDPMAYVDQILRLDDPYVYEVTVDQMRAHLLNHDHPTRLDHLVTRIREVAR